MTQAESKEGNDSLPGKNAASARTPHKRDAEATQKRILSSAKHEFAMSGLAGARVDVIAEKAEANKRMIYHYFGSKEALFTKVLEEAYSDLYEAERKLKLDHLEPRVALERFVRFTWTYYLENPDFITLVNSENLHKGVHLGSSGVLKSVSRNRLHMLENLLARGQKSGVFRKGIDAMQLHISIAALGYYYLTNRYTGSIVFRCDLMAPEMLEKRIEFNVESILRIVGA
ncbi:TetR/AcrR family transcriptional regulator [Acetobacter tropicalis]|uniref:Transcriptional regulator, TetR family n=1 Tax=Acetobacter tropicalis TaxID=104102 RepID=A0A095AW66_9PROT|nr:TetR family transcriptional regulator [Acetobacter tropicalis]KAA8383550.1 TetR/AcrR family transcriptional regulator [Acetobacter tropicalis]KAA8389333.1 TetR/AcrR family transcriptional regulator [Acetobacter tropicalis]KGB21023.1 Transcriptional regulator, TetR family [Acetobacter tropicalis]MBC9008669.1 TetR family transcriptional regulator [Acetobacter tropicalis]MDO8173046.1 TetR family transcriptional regulator [Acetobacter tropicalis]